MISSQDLCSVDLMSSFGLIAAATILSLHLQSLFVKAVGVRFAGLIQSCLCGNIDCVACWNKSLASVQLTYTWSPKNEVHAHQVLLKSHRRIWFDCPTCKHSFEAVASNVAAGKGCGFCSVSMQKALCR